MSPERTVNLDAALHRLVELAAELGHGSEAFIEDTVAELAELTVFGGARRLNHRFPWRRVYEAPDPQAALMAEVDVLAEQVNRIVQPPPEPERLYIVRRADGELLHGEYTWAGASGPTDWEAAETDADGSFDGKPIDYELVTLVVEHVERRTLPLCRECQEPATHWGLCERHAREDDPEAFVSDPAAGDEEAVVREEEALVAGHVEVVDAPHHLGPQPDPRPVCTDGGTCHHDCLFGGSCWRVLHAEPLSGVFPRDEWPQGVLDAHRRERKAELAGPPPRPELHPANTGDQCAGACGHPMHRTIDDLSPEELRARDAAATFLDELVKNGADPDDLPTARLISADELVDLTLRRPGRPPTKEASP